MDLEAAFVLILVLMEDTLRDHDCKRFEVEVLILVLMEDTLRVWLATQFSSTTLAVLILVLMEDTLREQKESENNCL